MLVDVMETKSLNELLTGPATLPVPEGGSYLRLGRSASYEAAKRGLLPTIKVEEAAPRGADRRASEAARSGGRSRRRTLRCGQFEPGGTGTRVPGLPDRLAPVLPFPDPAQATLGQYADQIASDSPTALESPASRRPFGPTGSGPTERIRGS